MILNPKLLIVDDERGIVDMIQSYFQTRYDILTAYSGQEALKKVACKPDLILLDINMLDRRIFDELLCHAAIAATYHKYPFCIRVDRHRVSGGFILADQHPA